MPSSPGGGPAAEPSVPIEDLARLVETSPMGYLTSHADGRIEHVNATLLRWLGYERTDLVGVRSFQQLLAPGGRIYYDTHLRPMLQMQSEVREIAVEIVRADDTRMPVLINVSRRSHPRTGDEVIETIVFDATERRRYEQQLLLERRLAEQSEARLQFLYDVVSGLAGATTAEEILEVIGNAGSMSALGASCAVWLFEHGEQAAFRLGAAAEDGSTTTRFEFPHGGTALDRLHEGEVVVIADSDVGRDTYPLLTDWLVSTGRRSAVVAPLRQGGVLAGVLGYGFDDPHDFDEAELRAVRSFAGQAEQALGRAAALASEQRSRARLSNLLHFTAMLSESLTLDDVIDSIVESATTLLGAIGVRVALLDESKTMLTFARGGGLGGGFGSEESEAASVDDSTIAGEVIRTGEVVVRPTRASLAASFPQSPILAEPKMGRVIGAPLLDGDESVGAWVLVFADEGPPDDDDTKLVQLFVDQAAQAIRRGRMFDLERRVAMTLQQSLLAEVPDAPGWTIDTWYAPGTDHLVVGGDLFDITVLDDGRMVATIADVVGHGLGAAAAMGQLRSAAKALALVLSTPAALLRGLDEFARTTPDVRYSSVCCVMFDADGTGRYGCAGHPYPLLRSADGTVDILSEGRSALLGVPGEPRRDAPIVMEEGSTLVVYTDGLVERRDGVIDAGVERLRDLLGPVQFAEPNGHAQELVVAMLDGSPPADDIVVVCVTRDATRPA